MPIAIVGTGRSGTSMIARMLNLCGVYLGEAADLNVGGSGNQKGFWEHPQFLEFNERLLSFLGASYETPARLAPGWEYDSRLDSLYTEASSLIERCLAAPARAKGAAEWGWKLPGATSTLPFWQRVVPNLKTILSVRNPLDYAASIENHAFIAPQHALTLWQYYNLDFLNATAPATRVITVYEDYFPDYRRALEPLLLMLGLPCPAPGSALDAELADFHEPKLNHHATQLKDLITDVRVPYLAKELYLELLLDSSGRAEDVPITKLADVYLPLLHQALTPRGEKDEEAQLKRSVVDLQRRNTHLERVLASRTHRLADRVCNLLIWASSNTFLRPKAKQTFRYAEPQLQAEASAPRSDYAARRQ